MTSTRTRFVLRRDRNEANRAVRRGRARSWRIRLVAAGLALGVGMLQLGLQASPAAGGGDYLLLSRNRLQSLPTSGDAWRYLVSVANGAWPRPELDDQENKTNVQALAAALVYARTGDSGMRAKARNAIEAMIPTYNLSHDTGLGPARQIAGWVLTADFIELDGSLDGAFRDLLRRALTRPIGSHSRWGGSLKACHEDSDNNWGAWCGASRIAAARYLGDSAELQRAWQVHRGFLGDRDAYSGFRGQGSSNGTLNSAIRTWSCDASPAGYVPTNPDCGARSGAFPADASRNGPYTVFHAAYQSETTAGVVLSTELLYQAGFSNAWSMRDALARIAAFDYKHGAWNLGSVQYHWPWLINKRLGTRYPTVAARYGRTFGYTDWLYGSGGSDDPVRTPDPNPDPTRTPDPDPTRTPNPDPTPDESGPAPDPTPSATKRGKGHQRPRATATTAPGVAADGGVPIGPAGAGTTTNGADDIGGKGSTTVTADGKAKAGGADKPGKRRLGEAAVTAGSASGSAADAAYTSTAALIALATIIAGSLALLLLRTQRRPDSA